ncbi:unannotated protein [freshwater metagenome]|uniref:Unannotated protein n=1 Tax=freshwater metagenome TaxID=449393 RepID=A0A6J7EH22_9ZZZZ
MPVNVNTASAASLAALEDVAPAALLVRPAGAVLIDSLKPFRFGTVPEDSLSDCWERVVSTWPPPEMVDWARSIRTSSGIGRSAHVPYRDEEVALVPAAGGSPAGREVADEAIPSATPQTPERVDLGEARETVVGLALARPYSLAAVRSTGSGARGRYVRVVEAETTHRLNETAARVMDACDGGTPLAAVEQLARRGTAVARAQIEADVLGAVRSLVQRKILLPGR